MSEDYKNHPSEYCAQVLVSRLGSGVARRRFARGNELFHEDAPARSAFLILEGYIELGVSAKQDRKGVVDLLTTGDFLGTCCIDSQAVHYFTAVALTDSACLEVDRGTLLRICRADNNFLEKVLSLEASQCRRSIKLLRSFLFHSSEERLGHILLQLEETYDRGSADRGLPRISHQTFAEMVGTTRPRISVFFKRFREAGLFKEKRRLDREKMQAYLDEFSS